MGPSAGASTRPSAGPGLVARLRRDAPWWVLPATVVTSLTTFSGYALWTALLGHDRWGPYLSPFYSPEIAAGRTRASSAIFVAGAPLLFRFTCYYYRKAYYRSFLLDPPACAVRDPHRTYSGETSFPTVLNNLHRYVWWLVAIVVSFLWLDVFRAFFGTGADSGHIWLGVGTGVMLGNVVLLTAYSASCHSFRHMVGGHVDCFSCVRFGKARYQAWRGVTLLNIRHPMWAWVSMFSVWGTDIYLRMLQAGWFLDPHIRF
ncbi:MAG: succinate dehydrogenase [Chloroflexi bacterium]|nr:MAG: succinate dehydrogenase [Chloroflexota bacterium]